VVQSKLFSTNKTLRVQGRLIDFYTPRIMGIVNVTPDSFYGGSRYQHPDSILPTVETILIEGADFIDVGGYSSRPKAVDIPVQEELNRVVPVIQLLKKNFPEAIISIDTFRSAVAEAALQEGATVINDISGGSLDDAMFATVAKWKVPYIMMHMRGTPQTMASLAQYENLTKDIIDHFHQKIEALHRLSVSDIIIDPGFGFAKTSEQNYELLKNLQDLQVLGKPMLVGLSRKSMIWKTLQTDPEKALNGTTALNTIALLKGADILRVHDVKEAAEVVKLIKFVQ
jgi:dihydropteroate synthase